MSNREPARQSEHFVADFADDALGAVDAVRVGERTSNLWIDAWRDLRGRWMFWVSGVVILLVITVALFPSLFTAEPPNDGCFLANSNDGPTAGHPLGYTKQGCDVFSRIVHGTSTSLSVGILATLLVAGLGLIIGGFAGFFGGWLDSLLMRISDIFFAIPYILAAVVIMSVFINNRNIVVISLAIGLFAWPSSARLLRSEILRVKQSDFVMASTAIGLSRVRTMVSHVIPNSIAPLIVVSTVGMAASITAEATLSFLGVGLPNSVMSWGNDISAAQSDLRVNPSTLIYPSIALSITVLAFIMLGETIREALDPKARALR
jgi:oligopeptide transport system permease protein